MNKPTYEELIAQLNKVTARVAEFEQLQREQEEILAGFPEITCRNGIKHKSYTGCIYCELDRANGVAEENRQWALDEQKALAQEQKKTRNDGCKCGGSCKSGKNQPEEIVKIREPDKSKDFLYNERDSNGSCPQCSGPEFHNKYCPNINFEDD